MSRLDEERWAGFSARLGADPEIAAAVFRALDGLHAVPRRPYHGLSHVMQTLGALDELTGDQPPAAAELALWFHDAICVPAGDSNEERSAAVLDSIGPSIGVDAATLGDATRAILATKRHREVADEVARLVVDADLSILGQPTDVYERYAGAIRAEYGAFGDAEYAAGRASFLEGLLARNPIFLTGAGVSLYEGRARANIERELSKHRGS
ncbi:MAG: hypothetical protein AAGI53_16435 [Planctomycetota bacterium]